MKRYVIFIFGIFLFLGLISLVSAGCVSDDDIIIKLSAPDNAHGALWNQSGYVGLDICYNSLFDSEYNEENDPQECDSNNILLYLGQINNSHASIGDSQVYNISVCHKGLKGCGIVGNGGCDLGNADCQTIVYISNTTTNAHLSKYARDGYSAISCACTEFNCEKKDQPVGPTGCYGYEDANSCNNDVEDFAMGEGCDAADPLSCDCVWNNATNYCDVQYYSTSEDGLCTYTCAVKGTMATECSADGTQIIGTMATITSTSELPGVICDPDNAPEGFVCQSSSKTVLCGPLEEVALPFFGSWQIVSSLISIALIYALVNRREFFS